MNEEMKMREWLFEKYSHKSAKNTLQIKLEWENLCFFAQIAETFL